MASASDRDVDKPGGCSIVYLLCESIGSLSVCGAVYLAIVSNAGVDYECGRLMTYCEGRGLSAHFAVLCAVFVF